MKTSAMGLLEEEDDGLGFMGQVLDHANLTGCGPFSSAGALQVASTLLSALKKGVSLHSNELC